MLERTLDLLDVIKDVPFVVYFANPTLSPKPLISEESTRMEREKMEEDLPPTYHRNQTREFPYLSKLDLAFDEFGGSSHS